MKEKATKAEKRQELLKIGLTENDINTLFFTERMVARQGLKAQAADRARQQLLASYTFGVEIECYNARPATIGTIASRHGMDFRHEGYNHTDHRGHYKLVSDASIHGNDPCECVSPILGNTEQGFSSLKECCAILNESGARVNRSTGLHVHVGGNISERQYCNVFANYYHPENVINTFMAQSRRYGNTYCKSLHGNADGLATATTIADVQRSMDNGQPLLQNQQPCVGSPSHHRVPPASGQHQLREDSSVGAFLHQTRTLVCRQPTDRRRCHNRRHRVSDRRRKGILQEPFPSPCSPLIWAASARHGHQYHQPQ